MKIIVFGANGKTGRKVIEQALASGMEVTAFVRNKESIQIASEKLQIVTGQATVYEDVKNVVSGHEAVINCIGGPGTKVSTVITEITRNIVKAMNEAGVKRIVQISSAGVHNELKGIIGKFISFILRNTLNDHKGAYAELRKGQVEFTLARPMSLTEGDFTGIYKEAEQGVPDKATKISRADVAHFLLKAVQDENYIGKSVGLGY